MSKWAALYESQFYPNGVIRNPGLLSPTYIDLPLSFEEVARVAALAPPEPERTKSTGKHRRNKGSVVDRAAKYMESVEPAISGQNGHKVAYRAACTLIVDFGLSIEEARPIFQEYNQRCQPPWSDEELEHKLEDADKSPGERGKLANTSSPMFQPREVNEFESIEQVVTNAVVHPTNTIVLPSVDDSPLVDADVPFGLSFEEIETVTEITVSEDLPPLRTVPMEWMTPRSPEGRTDIANGKRLARMISGKAKYIPAWETWIVWDGKRWRQDSLGIREFAKLVPGTIFADAQSPGQPVDTNACLWAIKSSSKASIEAMISLVRSEPGVSVNHSDLDADPWLLNCQNGIVDLRTGQLSPHDPGKLITRITNVDYDPDAETYEWDRFLEKILVEESLIGHVQRLIGYCITGSTREQVLPIFWGEGSNGKSTLLDTLKSALGTEYASTAPPGLIMQKRTESHPTELAGLCGKRMVTAIETEKNQKLNEPLVKQITGGDSISARRMKENFWEFRPTHKLILCTNHEPRVGDDFAIWRRLVLIPFTVQFWNPAKGESGPPELERDNGLPSRLEKCLTGVLSWAVRGSIEWYKNGLGTDEKTRAATAGYRQRQDVFGQFIEEVCCKGEQYKVKFSDLYEKYEAWAKASGEYVRSGKSFGEWLLSHKFERHRSNGIWILGLTWKPEYDSETTFE